MGDLFDVEPLMPFYLGCAGALVMHRNLWAECRGNDETISVFGDTMTLIFVYE